MIASAERLKHRAADEDDLVVWAQAGDKEAMAELFTRYRRPLTLIATGIAGADGEDALMEVMCTFERRLRSFDPARGPFGGWLRRVTVNQAYSVARAGARRREAAGRVTRSVRSRLAAVSAREEVPDLATEADNPEERVTGRAVLRGLMRRLSPRERFVLVASAFTGLSDEEIASELEVSSTTVRTLRHKARAKLEVLLGSEPAEGPRGRVA